MANGMLVSFVIATHNRGKTLVECLAKVRGCGLPADQFEIWVVDNASTDGTAEMVEGAYGDVRVIRLEKNCGPVAKNAGLAKARGEFVVVLDDDAYPHPGAVMQMVRHFRDDATLGAATFDVTLPDGAKEASAYPDVFIGAGTGFRRSVLKEAGLFPADFFMQAEEYDLSFRILQAGYSVQRFWDMPLTHLKSPGARIGQRTTRLDVRNNLYLLAKYVPEPLATHFAADWLARYWLMAVDRDKTQAAHATEGTHRKAFLKGSAEGMSKWASKREGGRHVLSPEVVERIFKIDQVHRRMGHAVERLGGRVGMRVVFADFGKNMFAYWSAAKSLGLEMIAVCDDSLGCAAGAREYRGVPLVTWRSLGTVRYDAVIVSNMSPVAGPRRAGALRRVLEKPVVDLFERVPAGARSVCGSGMALFS